MASPTHPESVAVFEVEPSRDRLVLFPFLNVPLPQGRDTIRRLPEKSVNPSFLPCGRKGRDGVAEAKGWG